MRPYLVLGSYYPKTWSVWVVGPQLIRFTAAQGLVPHPDPVHGPLKTADWYSLRSHVDIRAGTLKGQKAKQGTDWHQDGDTTPGAKMDHALVMWCSADPTEMRYKEGGEVYQPRPYEVVISRNLGCYHRRPPTADPTRWVFRQRVVVPEHLHLP